MSLDASVIKEFVYETQFLVGSKIDKIYQPLKDDIVISLRSFNVNQKLYISANASCPRIFLTQEKSDNPPLAPMFCMLLRKHLISSKITEIYQYDFERIIIIKLSGYDELSEPTDKYIVIELMGKYSNIILLNEDKKIIDSVKRIDISTSEQRQILPGLTYKFPEKQNKLNPLLSDGDFPFLNGSITEKDIMSRFYGISKVISREICYISEKKGTEYAVNYIFEKIRDNKFSPCVIFDTDMTPIDFSSIEINQYENKLKIEKFCCISDAIEYFYKKKAQKLKLHNYSSEISKVLINNIERCKKKAGIFKKQLLDCENMDKYRRYGELITANIYKISEGMDYAEVSDYFDESYPTVKIKLDAELSPSKNAARYFLKYTKAKATKENTLIQLKRNDKELAYLDSVYDSLLRANAIEDIKEIKDELISEGYISRPVSGKQKKKKETVCVPKEFLIDGYTVYVGKNNRQNDYLTLKMARSHDIWLHTKNIPGSHIIIVKKTDEEIPDGVITKAAMLAAINSKAKGQAKTPVDYTNVKNVKKPSGAKAGMVIYNNYNTLYVTPDEEIIMQKPISK